MKKRLLSVVFCAAIAAYSFPPPTCEPDCPVVTRESAGSFVLAPYAWAFVTVLKAFFYWGN